MNRATSPAPVRANTPPSRRGVRALLAFAAALALAMSCSPGFEPPSKVTGLRVLAITTDRPYARGGDEVTLAMTVTDGLASRLANEKANGTASGGGGAGGAGMGGAAGGGGSGMAEGAPRPLQILWLGGCFDPPGDQYFLCFEQLAALFADLGRGGLPPAGLVSLATTDPASDGVPDAHTFTLLLPEDIVTRRPKPSTGPHYGIAYVFFAACAGTLVPAAPAQLGSAVPEFPLACLDADGNPQGAESFVPGYTQIYAFADERENLNPPTDGLELDDVALSSDPSLAVVVPRCTVTEAERRSASCSREQPLDACTKHRIDALVPDVAELVPDGKDESGKLLRETIWVDYFADGGDFDTQIKLVSDARVGYLDEHGTEWTPPSEPGLYSLWAVTRDQRGGSSVVRGFVRVE